MDVALTSIQVCMLITAKLYVLEHHRSFTCHVPFYFSYTHNSIELQLRQLADMAFLLQNYDLAIQSYQHLKKDFQGASAWMYYAGVVEMIGMCTYLLSSTRREVVSYLEEAMSVYYSSCKLVA